MAGLIWCIGYIAYNHFKGTQDPDWETMEKEYMAEKRREREAGIVILRVPEYYEKFSCIASRCKDSCCAGWEIDIDEDSYAYYNSVEGKFGKRLKESMYEADPDDDDGGGYRFKLKGKKRCAMLNDHNLCDLYTALGEEALCEVCTEYPRFSPDLRRCGAESTESFLRGSRTDSV